MWKWVNLKVKFVKVGEWFDWSDRLKIKFNGRLPNYPWHWK